METRTHLPYAATNPSQVPIPGQNHERRVRSPCAVVTAVCQVVVVRRLRPVMRLDLVRKVRN